MVVLIDTQHVWCLVKIWDKVGVVASFPFQVFKKIKTQSYLFSTRCPQRLILLKEIKDHVISPNGTMKKKRKGHKQESYVDERGVRIRASENEQSRKAELKCL